METKNKKIKIIKYRIIPLILIFILLLSFPLNAMASQSIDDQLLDRGYPRKLIENMLEEEKNDLINENCYYESSKVYNYDEDGKLINITTFNDSAITPFGQISSSTLSLRITTSKSGSNTIVTFNYDWMRLPLNRYQDPICVAWDSSVFSYKSGTFKKVDQYTKIINGPKYTHSSQTTYADAGSSYISWYADLKGYTALPEQLFGYGKFTLVPKKTGRSTQIFGHYVHAKTGLSISISYKGAGFSISGTSTYDELGTDITIKS